jgi:hypothetical protein
MRNLTEVDALRNSDDRSNLIGLHNMFPMIWDYFMANG